MSKLMQQFFAKWVRWDLGSTIDGYGCPGVDYVVVTV